MKSDALRLRLTVAITNYNHAQFLPAALEGILSQSVQADEIIIIDDASTDNSVEIIDSYAKCHRTIRLIRNNVNRGVIANSATLLELAAGHYYYAAAADDVILAGFIEKSLTLLENHTSAGLCSTLSYVIDKSGKNQGLLFGDPFNGRQVAYYVDPNNMRRLFYRHAPWFQGNTTIYRKNALVLAGGFRPNLGSFCDGFAQQVIALANGACFVPEPLAAWRRMPETYSRRIGMNPIAMREIRDAALGYMTGEYRGIFPRRYVRHWRCRWDSAIIVSYSRAKSDEWRIGLSELRSDGNVVGRVLLFFGYRAIEISLGLLLIAALFFRWFDVSQITRNHIARWRRTH